MYDYVFNARSFENNIEQTTSNSYYRQVEILSKTDKKPPVFDDFIALQAIKAQYKGHRNDR